MHAIRNGDVCGNGDSAARCKPTANPQRRGWLDWHSKPCSGENLPNQMDPMPTNLRETLAIGLFVVLAGYVGFSGIRLGLLLWQRFA